MFNSFAISDIPDSIFNQNRLIANEWYKQGKRPSYSNDIVGKLTAGYGRLDYHGYFEYPLTLIHDRIIIS
tara:strand:- start:15103 stop:15312 length:210 start_codon:yes stop_codon:yes gene_type:complete